MASHLRLSLREQQVVRGIFDDHKEGRIADALGVSPHTVNTYFRRLYRKLGVASRPQLIIRVMAEHLAAQDGRGPAVCPPGHEGEGEGEPGQFGPGFS